MTRVLRVSVCVMCAVVVFCVLTKYLRSATYSWFSLEEVLCYQASWRLYFRSSRRKKQKPFVPYTVQNITFSVPEHPTKLKCLHEIFSPGGSSEHSEIDSVSLDIHEPVWIGLKCSLDIAPVWIVVLFSLPYWVRRLVWSLVLMDIQNRSGTLGVWFSQDLEQ